MIIIVSMADSHYNVQYEKWIFILRFANLHFKMSSNLRWGRPEFESWLEDVSRSHPPYLSPTSLPVSSDLSYNNKGKNAKNKSLKKIHQIIIIF